MRIIELRRPSVLNSLNTEMVKAITTAIKIWGQSEGCRVILIKGAEGKRKSFCAGGDVVSVVKLKGDAAAQTEFFSYEYAMNHALACSKKPIVSLIDGVCMGGGMGLSVHGHFRIATENTLMAMPETAIGFYPDVGASFFLTRILEQSMAHYLALTGRRLNGTDA